MNFNDNNNEFQDAVLQKSSSKTQPAQLCSYKRAKFVDDDVGENFKQLLWGLTFGALRQGRYCEKELEHYSSTN